MGAWASNKALCRAVGSLPIHNEMLFVRNISHARHFLFSMACPYSIESPYFTERKMSHKRFCNLDRRLNLGQQSPVIPTLLCSRNKSAPCCSWGLESTSDTPMRDLRA